MRAVWRLLAPYCMTPVCHTIVRMIFRRKEKVITNHETDGEDHTSSVVAVGPSSNSPRPMRRSLRRWLVRLGLLLSLVMVFVPVLLFQPSWWYPQQLFDPAQQQQQPVLSHEAWQQMLDTFQSSLYEARAHPDIFLPIVLRGRKVYCRKEHAEWFKDNERFDNLVAVLEYALSFKVEAKTTWGLSSNYYFYRGRQQQQQATVLHLPLANHQSIPLVFLMGDYKTCYGKLFPRFAWCTMRDGETCPVFPVPTYTIFRSRPDQSAEEQVFHLELEQKYPWASKLRQAVWRGVATGIAPNGWNSLPRAQLVNYSQVYPDLIDAALVDSTQFQNMYPTEEPKLRNLSRFAGRMEMEDYQKYRAVVDIDGNSWSARFGQLLCMNTVVIKVRAFVLSHS